MIKSIKIVKISTCMSTSGKCIKCGKSISYGELYCSNCRGF